MSKTVKQAAPAIPAKVMKTKSVINMPIYMARKVHRIRTKETMKSSEFFRRLFDEANTVGVPLLKEGA